MRFLTPASRFFILGALGWSCVVYDSDLVTSAGGLSGAGNNSSEGGGGGASGGGQAKTGTGAAGSSTAGTVSSSAGEGGDTGAAGAGAQPAGGEGDGEGGEGGEPAGSGGSAGGTAGAGGSGGGATVAKCGDHPLTPKSSWIATASHSSTSATEPGLENPPSQLIDGMPGKRWSSGKRQAGDEWIQIDFGAVSSITQVTLALGTNSNDYPRAYAIRLSSTDQDFNGPVKASGSGMPGSDVLVTFGSPISGRYLLVRQTGVADSGWWSIGEVYVSCSD